MFFFFIKKGGEGGHGMIILSPQAVERIEQLQAHTFRFLTEIFSSSSLCFILSWICLFRPLPKIFRMLGKDGKINEVFIYLFRDDDENFLIFPYFSL